MRRADLEHAIRAATEIIAADEVIVIGSQAILGTYLEDDLPPEATMSVEVDMAPMHDDDAGTLATLLDGVLGELSIFHETNGFYVQGVGRETAVLPAGCERRLVPVVGPNTNGAEHHFGVRPTGLTSIAPAHHAHRSAASRIDVGSAAASVAAGVVSDLAGRARSRSRLDPVGTLSAHVLPFRHDGWLHTEGIRDGATHADG